jgi:tetratricopeptide (TPR) repeat protein
MSKREIFESILASNAFDQLKPFAEPLSWNTMTPDERVMLGMLFIKQGEQLLIQGDHQATTSFELASKVAPGHALVFFRLAQALSAQELNMRSFASADSALQKATELDPDFIDAWCLWGRLLLNMGAFCSEVAHIYHALEKFAYAEKLALKFDSKHQPTILWQCGLCWYQIGKHSGEAADYISSLEKFRLAAQAGCCEGQFFLDFGNLLVDLSELMKRQDLLYEAVDNYQKAAKLLPNHYASWTNLACTYKRLYEFDYLKEHYQQADEAFAKAIKLHPEHSMSWFYWAELLLNAGKHFRDAEKLRASIEKFAYANSYEPDRPQILLLWGEAQMLLASHAEDLEQLRQAEAKVVAALHALSDRPEAWCIYGFCLESYGRYFASENYYLQAIEKFEYALTLVASPALKEVLPNAKFCILHSLALAYFEMGELASSLVFIQKSLGYFNEASTHLQEADPHFLNDWGIALLKMGELTGDKEYTEKATLKFEEGLNKGFEVSQGDPMELEWLYNYGCSLDFLGDYHEDASYYEKAIQILAHILKVDPDYSDAKYNLALACLHLAELKVDVESYRLAIELFQSLSEHDPEDDLVWDDFGYAWLNLALLIDEPACSEEEKHAFAQAERCFQQATALGNLLAYYHLSCLYACTDRLEESLAYLEKAEMHHVLPTVDDLLNDEWLDNLRNYPAYRLMISRLLNQQSDN